METQTLENIHLVEAHWLSNDDFSVEVLEWAMFGMVV